MGNKRVRDPIYGYLEIPDNLMNQVIDTPVFQRLRRIVQTSYAPLYPSALHNRFIHSLGVFHLGKLAVSALVCELRQKKYTPVDCQDSIDRYKDIFLLACLLHDIGHAPFSHTGEKLFLERIDNARYVKIHRTLRDLIGTQQFADSIPEDSKAAAAHELMSAIVGIRQFGFLFNDSSEKEFFARCITGYLYSDNDSEWLGILNCFISLLNSKVIDVDRLDYLIRDTFFTGVDSVNIDYIRLLSSLTIVKVLKEEKDKSYYEYSLAYNKGAISTIESVVFARDSARKWIQTHPAVLYESYILQHIMERVNLQCSDDEHKLFSEEALTEIGCTLKNGYHASLLCDDDIICLMKNMEIDDLSKEFFSRKDRPKLLWKSEAEFRDLELQHASSDGSKALITALTEVTDHVRTKTDDWFIDDNIIEAFRKEADAYNEAHGEGNLRAEQEAKRRTNERINKLFTVLQNCFKSYGLKCKCIVLKASSFSSGFDLDFQKIKTIFSPSSNPRDFTKVVTSLSGLSQPSKDFFYIFYYIQKLPSNDGDAHEVIADIDPSVIANLKNDLRKKLFGAF